MPSDESIKDDRPYTTEEIGQVLKECDLRSKAIILLLCSSGMRKGALHLLRINHLVEMNNQHHTFKTRVYAGTHDEYFTFCTPECYNAIQDYLNYRKRCGEKLESKSPLIREQFNVDDHIRIQYPRFVSEKGMEHIIDNALKRSGVRKPREVHLSHGFRKFFITQCESSPMKSLHVSMLAGHDTGPKKSLS
jgi:integrase